MTPRMRRLVSDYDQVMRDFTGHSNIIVTPVGDEAPEQYRVTYFVNGIYLLPDGKIETLSRHEVEITLHAEYPRYKPLCKILTPIWHPNFRDGQICIGDIWGAGESLTDIIINIGDMIQYKSWNSYSPLSADAAKWAMENKHLFPVGNIDLYIPDPTATGVSADGPSLDIEVSGDEEAPAAPEAGSAEGFTPVELEPESENDFDITPEELENIEFIPTSERMQGLSRATAKGKKINFMTVLVKGLLWALIGAILGFIISELTEKNITSEASAASLSGNGALVDYYHYNALSEDGWETAYSEYRGWCSENGLDYEESDNFTEWMFSGDESYARAEPYLEVYYENEEKANEALYNAYEYAYNGSMDRLEQAVSEVTRTSTAMWSAVIALFIGLSLGIGEGVYYGSASKAVKYGLIGAGVSLVMGYISGYLAQWMYTGLLDEEAADVVSALVRGLGWAIMGLGIGAAVGLIKPEKKRILFCSLGGLIGAFVGGFLFDYVLMLVPNDMVSRGIAIVIMGILIGVGVGLLEQFAKAAWLKVVRGEFEGKEYLVFSGTTSIGNNGKNTIVLFKDKLVSPHHCDIKLEGSSYVLIDCGTPMGTVVNGRRITRHVLRQGDSIAIGNSVLVFNTK